jgi:hypothetical protein
MALHIPRSIFHLAWLLYVRAETFGPTLVYVLGFKLQKYNSVFGNPIHHPKTDALVLKVYCSDIEGQQYFQQLSYCAAT